jgi:hypothetical protein
MCIRGWSNTQALVGSCSVSVYLFLCGGGEDSRSLILWSVKTCASPFLSRKGFCLVAVFVSSAKGRE